MTRASTPPPSQDEALAAAAASLGAVEHHQCDILVTPRLSGDASPRRGSASTQVRRVSVGAPSGFRTPDPLIKSERFSLLPAVSGCVPYSVGRQCFAYFITSCRSRSTLVDCVSFAPHKRHRALDLAGKFADGHCQARSHGQSPSVRSGQAKPAVTARSMTSTRPAGR